MKSSRTAIVVAPPPGQTTSGSCIPATRLLTASLYLSKADVSKGAVTVASAEVGRTVAGSEEGTSRRRKEMDLQKQMEDLLHARVKVETRDVQLLSVSYEEVLPEQKERSRSQDQDDPQKVLHIKEEQEDLWTNPEGEHLQGLEEADIIKFTFNPVSLKSEEDDEEQPQFSQLHHTEVMKIEADGDCGGPEPDKNFIQDSNLQPDTEDITPQSSEPETDDSRDWEETSGSQSLNRKCNTGEVTSFECSTNFGHNRQLREHSGNQTEIKTFSCSVCGKEYLRKKSLTVHMRIHSEGKSFTCSVCQKTFPLSGDVVRHMRVHTGEKPFGCSVCGTRFTQKGNLRQHMIIHSGQKPYSCSECGKGFATCGNLRHHVRTHTGEKPFDCSVCGTRFTQKGNLTQHMMIHSGEKSFCCSVCGKGFAKCGNLRQHMRIHTGERPFSCSVCDKSFTQMATLQRHKCVDENSGSK